MSNHWLPPVLYQPRSERLRVHGLASIGKICGSFFGGGQQQGTHWSIWTRCLVAMSDDWLYCGAPWGWWASRIPTLPYSMHRWLRGAHCHYWKVHYQFARSQCRLRCHMAMSSNTPVCLQFIFFFGEAGFRLVEMF